MRAFEPGDVDELHRVFIDPGVRRFLLDDQIVSREWWKKRSTQASPALKKERGFVCVFSKDDGT